MNLINSHYNETIMVWIELIRLRIGTSGGALVNTMNLQVP
jgi:hypothetical protein